MKKNIMMRLSALLLVAVLLTTCVISGTWAKYVTSNESEDSARVAKFGVEIKFTNFDAFKDEYEGVVESSTEDDLVAPGTSGSFGTIVVTGTPEVDVNVEFEVTLTLTNWNVDGQYYCPLSITVGPDTLYGMDYDSADLFVAAVVEKIEAQNNVYQANENLANEITPVAVSWEWAFDSVNDVNDVKDTALGNAAAEGKAATIYLKIVCTVTQIESE